MKQPLHFLQLSHLPYGSLAPMPIGQPGWTEAARFRHNAAKQ
jgi:hypothetical protein